MATETTPSTPAAAAPTTSSAPAATPSTPATPATPPAGGTPPEQSTPDTRSTAEMVRDELSGSFDADGSLKVESDVVPDGTETPAGDTGDKPADENGDTPAEDRKEDEARDQPADEGEPEDAADTYAHGTTELKERIEESPEFKALTDADPELKGFLFAQARRAALVDQFREAGIASPEEAAIVVGGNNAFVGVSERFAALDAAAIQKGDFSGVDATMQALVEQTIIRDAEGNPVLGPDGQPRTDGSVGLFMRSQFMGQLLRMESEAHTNDDPEYQAAIDTIMDRNKLRGSSTPKEDGLTEEQATRQRELDERQASLDARDREQTTKVATDYHAAVTTANNATLDSAIKKVLDGATGLTPFARGKAEQDIRAALAAKLKTTTLRQELNALERMPYGPERQRKHEALAKRYTAEYLGSVARPILEQAGADVATKQQKRRETDAARRDAARSETGSSLSTGTPAAKTEVTMAQVEADMTARDGHAPTLAKLTAEYVKRNNP